MFDVGVTANGKIPQHVALFWDFNCNCSAYLPSVLVTHASGCTSAKVKILDIYGVFVTKISSVFKWKLRWTLSYPTLYTSLIFYMFLFLKTYWFKVFRQINQFCVLAQFHTSELHKILPKNVSKYSICNQIFLIVW